MNKPRTNKVKVDRGSSTPRGKRTNDPWNVIDSNPQKLRLGTSATDMKALERLRDVLYDLVTNDRKIAVSRTVWQFVDEILSRSVRIAAIKQLQNALSPLTRSRKQKGGIAAAAANARVTDKKVRKAWKASKLKERYRSAPIADDLELAESTVRTSVARQELRRDKKK